MKLEVGEYYLSASGEIVKIDILQGDSFISNSRDSFFENGLYIDGEKHKLDLIVHIPKQLHHHICSMVSAYHTQPNFAENVNLLFEIFNMKSEVQEVSKLADELMEELEQLKQIDEAIDLRNTWCINTEENYNELIKNGVKTHFKFNKEYKYLSVNSHLDMWATKVYGNKEIQLIDGKFQYKL